MKRLEKEGLVQSVKFSPSDLQVLGSISPVRFSCAHFIPFLLLFLDVCAFYIYKKPFKIN